MGGALARAVCGVLDTKVYVSDYNEEKGRAFACENGAEFCDNEYIARECDFVFLAVKPGVLASVIEPLKAAFSENSSSVIVSMAAGVAIEKIEKFVGASHAIIRIMPNTPVAIGEGMITWCKNALVSARNVEDFQSVLSNAGRLDAIDEKLIDAASAVAGCGPAFVYMFIEALADGGVQCGLPRDKALTYAAETLKGAASMVMKTGKHPGLLKDEVCSPGGSTIEGVAALEAGAFRATSLEAVVAAFEKTKKLGK